MPKYLGQFWIRAQIEIEADSAAAASAKLDEGLQLRDDMETLKIGVVQIDPPLPPPPPDKPKPTTPIRPRGGKPNGGGSPGTPVLGRYTITKVEAA